MRRIVWKSIMSAILAILLLTGISVSAMADMQPTFEDVGKYFEMGKPITFAIYPSNIHTGDTFQWSIQKGTSDVKSNRKILTGKTSSSITLSPGEDGYPSEKTIYLLICDIYNSSGESTGDVWFMADMSYVPAQEAPAVAQETKTPTEQITIPVKPTVAKVKSAGKKVTVTWKRFAQTKKTKAIWKKIKKIEIQYSTDKSFKNGVERKIVKRTKTSAVIKGLKKKTVYYVRVRYLGGNGECSKWSKVKKIRVKK